MKFWMLGKFNKIGFAGFKLKSPKTTLFPYVFESSSRSLKIPTKYYWIFCEGGYKQPFLFKADFKTSSSNLKLVKSFDGKEDFTLTKIPPLLLFIPIRRGLRKPGIKNCEIGNKESSFVPAIEIMPTLLATNHN